MANRPDIFGTELSSELASLQTRAEFFKATKPKEVYKMDPKPIAAASIAQVHIGAMKDGRRIAIKIKRPMIDEQMERELSRLGTIAGLVSICGFPKALTWFREFEQGMKDELDFSKEIRNLQMFQDMYAHSKDIRIPRVLPELSGKDHIVMEYLPSVSITTGDRIISENLMNAFVEQILYMGVVHGDLHAGNLGIHGKYTIVMYDLGNVIMIPKSYMKALREVLAACQSKDPDALLIGMKNMGMIIRNEETAQKFALSFFEYLDTLDPKSFRYSKSDPMVPIELDDMTLKILRTYSLVEGLCKTIYPKFTYENVIQQNMELLFIASIIV
jgi:ubiquinone biosynthesis protein